MKTARRHVLAWLSAAAAAPIAAQTNSPSAIRTAWRFFREEEARFVSAAVDRLIPEDDFPSASQAGVATYIDRQLAGPYGKGARIYLQGPFFPGTPQQGYQLPLTPAQIYRDAIAGLAPYLKGRVFAEMNAEQQDGFLKQLEAGGLLLGKVPSAVFFETLLANTIEGYFADPIYGGNRNMAGWRMIGFPGAYAEYVQWVDKHGIRFDREPISIADTTPHTHGS